MKPHMNDIRKTSYVYVRISREKREESTRSSMAAEGEDLGVRRTVGKTDLAYLGISSERQKFNIDEMSDSKRSRISGMKYCRRTDLVCL